MCKRNESEVPRRISSFQSCESSHRNFAVTSRLSSSEQIFRGYLQYGNFGLLTTRKVTRTLISLINALSFRIATFTTIAKIAAKKKT